MSGSVAFPFVLVFGVAFVAALALTPVSIHLGRRWGLVDAPGGRRAHRDPTPRTGGIALFIAFGLGIAAAFTFWPVSNRADLMRLTAIAAGVLFVFLWSLIDDWLDLPAWLQFVAQGAAAIIAIAGEVFIERFTNPINNQLVVIPDLLPGVGWGIVVAISVFWVVGMMNTVNWLDGLDGLAAGVGAIAAALFAIHSYRLGQTEIALFPTALTGACLGFLPYNFHPARVFLGTAGAMVLGYALATLSILAPARIATALLVLGIPILDVAWLLFSRWRRGVPIWRGGRDHLHYRLQALGLSQRQIVIAYYLFCLFFGLLAVLVVSRLFKLVALVGLGVVAFAALWWLSKETEIGNSPESSVSKAKD
jgi:UDP-GlcNAc:undecaprenyl-phosphate/decaprenyl-phosphate GlcNAc-1-phosphate transferase